MDNEQIKRFEADYDAVAKLAKENFEDWQERFGKNTYGAHELMDRCFVLYENWDTYVTSHPTSCIDKSLFIKAWKIRESMMELYQAIGAWQIEKSEKQ